jgi:hypothetical protein
MDDLFAGETRLLRERVAALEARLGRLAAAGVGGTHRMVGRVFSQGAIPTTSGKFYACHPVTVTGTETEGATPVKTVDTSQAFLVDLLGGSAAVGDDLVCRRVRHRWVARRRQTSLTGPGVCSWASGPTTITATLGGFTFTLTKLIGTGGATTYSNGTSPVVLPGVNVASPLSPCVSGTGPIDVVISLGCSATGVLSCGVQYYTINCGGGVHMYNKASGIPSSWSEKYTNVSYSNSPINAVFAPTGTYVFGTPPLPNPCPGNVVATQ